jgi:chloramphenicol 3-O phosphotransferase
MPWKYTVNLMSVCLVLLLMGACVYKQPAELCGTVIIINGPSAVGKSSIIKAFQARQVTPWLSIGIDNFFVGVLPSKFYLEDEPEHYAVMHGVASEDAHGKLFTLQIGPEGQKIIRGMHRAIAAYAREGNNVIVDYIKYDSAWISDLQESLKGIKVLWVGVTASLETIQQREKERGTSPEGHARSVYHTVHEGMRYDLMLNTDLITPGQAAEKIEILMKGKK